MADKNIGQKAKKVPREWSLTKKKVQFLDSSPKFSLSPNFGKQKPWVVRALEWVGFKIATFFSDLFTALKVIIREIM